ncbi:sulfotransferase family 2 domain-containing protein [Phaeovulum vinaykumarii]|uniref:Sulfotransferase family protein n=1 Tax=Phaeovulum vinaykumarii TaxID=407234 RepID=A0A1N7M4Z4_9RHOB|nr:sulfotransferase family 2 domain-containing protein [Phaeovulum vinaykumarii]SIS81021.1 Sulfotransferase family protein [Phaeovulum vinaykumarii]SOC08744.1 sulfotransferase family protein [Phaeovulum vinaykumarii]
MIVSHGRRYIFVHVPKTGGTALAVALEARAMADDILVGDTPKARRRKRRLEGVETRGRLWKHSTLSDGIGLYTEAQARGYFVFTLVRNPWDRLVSYYHWLRDQRFTHPAVDLARALPFPAFLNAFDTRAAIAANPYTSYVRLGREACCNLFIRLEHLEEDLEPLAAHLGFRPGPIERINASARGRDWRPYYSDKDAEMVGLLCGGDIARFGYQF